MHEPRAIESAGAKIGRERCEPRASKQTAGVAHRIVTFAFAPRAAPIRHWRADDHDGAGVVGVGRRQHHGGPTCLTVADNRRLCGVRMELAHFLYKLAFRLADVDQRLSGLGFAKKSHEVNGMAFAQRDTHLGVVLESANAGTVPAARVDDYIRASRGVDRDAVRRNDAQQRVIDGTRKRAAVHDHLVIEVQHGWQSLPLVLDEVIAAFAQHVAEENRALSAIDDIFDGLRPCI